MIAPAVVVAVRRLLVEGKLSQRKIARAMGISRGTVGSIAVGKRRDREQSPADEQPSAEPAGPPERCPGCGGTVYMPCLLCRARQQQLEPSRPAPRCESFEPLTLNLRPEHSRRCAEVRAAWRRQGGAQENPALSGRS